MELDQFLARARSVLALSRAARGLKPVPYNLGGTFDPDSREAPDSGLDCGGFVRWAATVRAAGRVDTTGLTADALGPQQFVRKLDEPRVGCLIVYPDYKTAYEGTQEGVSSPFQFPSSSHDGHVGIVTRVVAVKGEVKPEAVIHCSRLIEAMRLVLLPGTPRDSVIESDPLWITTFNPIYAWLKHVTPAP